MIATKLNEKWIRYCISQPETGMGFQRVKVNLTNGKTFEGFVFNCEELQTDTHLAINDISNIEVIV